MEMRKHTPNNEQLIAQAVSTVDLLSYQEGAVVSRTIVKRKTGTVTLFAFDTGEELSEHTAPFDALVYLIDGEAEITIAGQSIHAKTGQMVLMPANQPHALKAIKRLKMVLTMIRD